MNLQLCPGSVWRPILTAITAAALYACAGTVAAVTVHTWVDAAGVRHFADSAPAADKAVETIELDATAVGTAADDDYYSITNQWQRMREARDAADALQLERQRLRAAEREANAAPPVVEIYDDTYPGYLPYPHRVYNRSQRRPRHDYVQPRSRSQRDGYLSDRRRHGFTPTPVPQWPSGRQ